MSDDWDFEMEVVEDGELGSTASPSEGSIKPDDAANDDRSSTELVESKEEASSRFEGLPEAWAVHKLQEAAKVVGGSTPSTNNDEYWGGDMPWATPTDVTGLRGTTITETEDKITEEGLNSASTHILPEYSVLMTSRATIGACAVNTVPMATNQGFQSLVPGERLNTWYLFYRMLNEAPYLESLGAGSTFSEVSKRVVEKIDIPVPPLPEQRKIASVLYAVDQAIQKTEAILEKHRLLRRDYIDEVTTSGYYQHSEKQNIRVGPRKLEIPAMWEPVKLGNVTSLITKGQTPTSHGFEYQEDGINFVKAESIDEDGRLNENKFAHIGLEADEKLSRSRLRDGDVLFSIAGALGKVAQIEEQSLPANINQALALIRCDDERVDSRFVRYYLESRTIRKYVQSISTVTAQPNLSLKQVSEFDLFLPPSEEQLEIAQACEHFDRGIANEENQLHRLHKLKKGLMQDLLSGEVRTMDKAIEVLGEVKAHG